ncbi:MAG TPA: universal stress protein [Salinimicrobium sp.]|nr:universal stress protein [Salinimicrobium sp.]
MKEIKNIMVAVDFNDSVGELLEYAESIAKNFQSKLWVVYVSDDKEGFKENNAMLQSLCDNFLDEDLEHEAVLIEGSTVEKVIEEAKTFHTDLLVVGTHKHGFFHNLLSESVSLELFKKVDIPLLTIPIDDE